MRLDENLAVQNIGKRKFQAFIICWEGFEKRAENIAAAVENIVDTVVVIYSNSTDRDFNGTGSWIKVPNTWLYGLKFTECQRQFTGDVHIQIQADAHSEDWEALITRCKHAFSCYPRLGVWAPNVEYSPWKTQYISIRNSDDSAVHQVLQTDGVLWAFNKQVDSRLRAYDLGINNSGWGIDQLAICIAYRNGLIAVRDAGFTVDHPKSTGYRKSKAMLDKVEMTNQLNLIDKTTYRMIVYIVRWREGLSRTRSLPFFLRAVADRILVCASRIWITCLRLMSQLFS